MPPASFTISPHSFDAVIFDLDGVITRTAKVHEAAWKELFDAYLRRRAAEHGERFTPFSEEDYYRHVDGKPRYEGVADFLASRNLRIAYGEPDDPPDRETVTGLGNRKNEIFRQKLEQEGPEVYQSSIALIRLLKEAGLKIGLVSSSRNTVPILKKAAIEPLFDVKIDGIDAQERRLAGKPAPDLFLAAARDLKVAPRRTIVVEDAIAGVQAGRDGGFGRVIGVARSQEPQALQENGADVVVSDLAEVTVAGEENRSDELPSALNCLKEIEKRLSGRKPVFFLDYDGTLTPIVDDPAEALLPPATRAILNQLAEHSTVAVVSGRDLADVRRLVGLDSLYYAGSHGFDIAGPAGRRLQFQQGLDSLPALDGAEKELKQKLGGLQGVQVERKKFGIAVHFRKAPHHQGKVEDAVEAVLAGRNGLRDSGGKMILELRPDIDWDKGRAVAWLLEQLGLQAPRVLALYLGDDLTDEDAFRELRSRGITILVSDVPRPSQALYNLRTPGEVAEFLCSLDHFLERGAS